MPAGLRSFLRTARSQCTSLGLIVVLTCAGCADGTGSSDQGREGGSDRAASGFHFVETAREAGLDRVVHAGRSGKDHLLDSAGTGAAWLDYDRDGHLDAYIVNGWKIEDDRVVAKGRNALYRNRGDGTFEDVTEQAGVAGEGHWGSGVAVADYDADTWPDLLVTNFGPNLLYRNRGDGTFENVAARAGIEVPGWNTGAAFFDADADGDLDLYVAGYFEASPEDVITARRTLDWKGVEMVAPGPFGFRGAPDHFFLSDGRGGFEEATAAAGLTDLSEGYGFGVRAADLDEDGKIDLYVANDSDANYFYRNDGDATFREVGLWSGVALDINGAAQAGMGVAFGDADGDTHLDIFVTNFAQDFSTLYRGDGTGFFEDASDASGVGAPTYLPLSWGTVFADLDNDGDQDLVVANGHIYPQVDAHPQFGMTYRQTNQLLQNDGSGNFVDVSSSAGPGFAEELSTRGLAAGDFDDDGDLDLLLTHLDEPPSLLRNDTRGGTWLRVQLEVSPGNGNVVGARVYVEAGDRRWMRDAASGESFLSVHDPRLHFGLGDRREVDRVRVVWPDGAETTRSNVACCQTLTVHK